MAHNEQREFFQRVKNAEPSAFVGGKVLEVGSLDINGTVRDFFESPEEYIGIDVGPGPGVDRVLDGKDIDYPDDYFDVTVSAECFEHNPHWVETFEHMVRVTKRSGFIMFTCASEGRAEHGTARSDVGSSPLTVAKGWNYYRNLNEEDFDNHLGGLLDGGWRFYYNPESKDLYFIGRKDDSFALPVSHPDWI